MSREISTCRVCKKQYWQGNIEGAKDICNDCKQKEWFREMKAKGCTVAGPENLGREPYFTKIKKADLPEVTIDSEKYIDVMSLLFEDGRYVKTYPADEEWEKIREAQYLKRRAERKRDLAKELERERKEEEKERKIKQKEEKLKGLEIVSKMEKRMQLDEVERKRKLRNKLIIEYRKEGLTYQEISDKVDLSPSSVREIISKAIKSGEVESKQALGYTTNELELIIKLVNQGEEVDVIAKTVGRTSQAVQTRISRMRKDGVEFEQVRKR